MERFIIQWSAPSLLVQSGSRMRKRARTVLRGAITAVPVTALLPDGISCPSNKRTGRFQCDFSGQRMNGIDAYAAFGWAGL